MALLPRHTRDGSFSLYSEEAGEGFHRLDGALAEARDTFLAPADLARFRRGDELRVVEIAVGTGTNTAALIEVTRRLGLGLRWRGLELERQPLELALADDGFRNQWSAEVLAELTVLVGEERLLWGDARQRIAALLAPEEGRAHLVLHDAFSPRRCPQLWSEEFLGSLARLLRPDGRLITYCSAAAVRASLRRAGLALAAIRRPGDVGWSGGTVASPTPLPESPWLRDLSPMELEHLASRAGLPYRDPDGLASAATILAARSREQEGSGAESGSRWQRRWGLERRHTGRSSGAEAPPEQGR